MTTLSSSPYEVRVDRSIFTSNVRDQFNITRDVVGEDKMPRRRQASGKDKIQSGTRRAGTGCTEKGKGGVGREGNEKTEEATT